MFNDIETSPTNPDARRNLAKMASLPWRDPPAGRPTNAPRIRRIGEARSIGVILAELVPMILQRDGLHRRRGLSE